MTAKFDTVEEFLKELRASKESGDRISDVRCRTSETQQSRAAVGYSVVAGFHDNQYLYELTIDCGMDFDDGTGTKTASRDRAADACRKIEECCGELGIRFRNGRWELN